MKLAGTYAIGETFWDRKEDIRLFMDKIREGNHLLLVAQRRMGKTSLMMEAAERLKNDFTTLYVDLEKAFDGPDTIKELGVAAYAHKSLRGKVKDLFANALASIRKSIDTVSIGDVGIHLRDGLDKGTWPSKGDGLLEVMAASEKPVLLMFDEIPIMVNRMLKGQDYTITPERKRDVDQFMSWLRRNSIAHQGKIRMVLTGSIGFEPVLHQAGLSATLNTFHPFDLPPWDRAAAVGCLDALAEGYGIRFEDGTQDKMVDMLGCCIPEHVEMFFSHVRDRCHRNHRHEFRKSDVAEVYRDEMLGARGHAALTHYEERLKMVLGNELSPLAFEMLSEAAITGCLGREQLLALQAGIALEQRSPADAQKEIIHVLEHDGYFRGSRKGYVFVSHLVRDWWKKTHEQFFTPVLERKRKN